MSIESNKTEYPHNLNTINKALEINPDAISSKFPSRDNIDVFFVLGNHTQETDNTATIQYADNVPQLIFSDYEGFGVGAGVKSALPIRKMRYESGKIHEFNNDYRLCKLDKKLNLIYYGKLAKYSIYKEPQEDGYPLWIMGVSCHISQYDINTFSDMSLETFHSCISEIGIYMGNRVICNGLPEYDIVQGLPLISGVFKPIYITDIPITELEIQFNIVIGASTPLYPAKLKKHIRLKDSEGAINIYE
jgi:hypothetical protein